MFYYIITSLASSQPFTQLNSQAAVSQGRTFLSKPIEEALREVEKPFSQEQLKFIIVLYNYRCCEFMRSIVLLYVIRS